MELDVKGTELWLEAAWTQLVTEEFSRPERQKLWGRTAHIRLETDFQREKVDFSSTRFVYFVEDLEATMAQGQPKLQSPFIPGQKEPADLALEQEISQQPQTKKPGSFMRFFSRNTESSQNGGGKGTGPVEEDNKQQGHYYAPVPTKFGAKKGSDENPSSHLDGPREGAEMSDVYSPQCAVESTVTQSNPGESFEVVESSLNIAGFSWTRGEKKSNCWTSLKSPSRTFSWREIEWDDEI